MNDRTVPFEVRATASLDPLADSGDDQPIAVRIAVDVGDGFEQLSKKTKLPAAGQMRIRLSAPATATAGQSGWLTVVATAGSDEFVARRALGVPVPSPTVKSWATTSTQGRPTRETGGDLDAPLPLSSDSGCESLDDPKTVLVSDDETVSITSTCDSGNLRLKADDFGPGTYKGTLEVGSASVDLEVRRTVSAFWPILFICLGILAAIASQGRTDQSWRMQQRRWLRRLPKDAAKADAKYFAAARELPWEAYTLEPAIDDEKKLLGQRLDEVAAGRPWVLRWLPWPEGFMAAEREKIRTRIAELDELVRKWPAMPSTFEAALAGVNRQPYYVTRAPRLVERAFLIIGADGLPIDATELAARCAEAAALPDALDVIEDLERLDAYVAALEEDTTTRPRGDETLLIRARQYERQASATLAELSDSRKVVDEVGRVVKRAARLASRLPRPRPPTPEGGIQTETVPSPAAAVVGLPLVLLRRATALFGDAGPSVGHSAVILVTLAVGVLSGLAVLYFGKAWGGSWTDYAAAFVWGYAASTVIDPIVAAIRQVGTRPGDTAAPKAAT